MLTGNICYKSADGNYFSPGIFAYAKKKNKLTNFNGKAHHPGEKDSFR